ncbi:MAG TPA: polysaccharide biosynthesis C-terminal domain-containing protein, partial [Clostridia bacterium]
WDFKSLYIAYCLGTLANIVILESKCKIILNYSKEYFDRGLFKALLRFSLPLCLNSIAFWFLSSANKLIVTWILGEAQNGYLAIANKFTGIIYLVSTCFQLAWQETAYSQENDINSKSTGEYYSKAFDLYTRILLVGVLIIIPVIKIIFPFFVDSSYNSSAPLIPLALMGTIMSILSSFLGSIFGGIKKTSIIFFSTLSGAIVNLIVIFSIIKVVGVNAANIAFLAGFTVNVLFRTIALKKLINMKVNYWYYVLFVPLFISVVLVYNYCNWVINLIVSIIFSCFCLLVLKNEIKIIWGGISRKSSRQ